MILILVNSLKMVIPSSLQDLMLKYVSMMSAGKLLSFSNQVLVLNIKTEYLLRNLLIKTYFSRLVGIRMSYYGTCVHIKHVDTSMVL